MLSLPLLVTGIIADHTCDAFSPNDLAVIAHIRHTDDLTFMALRLQRLQITRTSGLGK